MKQYIPKSAVVAEIERLKDIQLSIFSKGETQENCNDALTYISVYNEILSFLDTLEVKEVDLEKEIELVKGDYEQVNVAWNNDFDYIAKHFFELGIQQSKNYNNNEE